MAKSDVLVKFKSDTGNYDANIAKAQRTLKGFVKDNLSAGGAMKQLSSSLISTAARFASITAAVGAFGAALKSNISTAREFEKSMSQLSSLTGMVGADLNKLKDYAIDLGASTTLTASEVANAFKMIGSQQPQLLKSAEALKEVTKNAITLSEAAGIDLATASQTLSTSINQMGGDSNNAARFINVLAAASQKGAGDIAWLGEAITKSGTTAKMVGASYEELVANLEQLAQAGFDASTAGTALRSIIVNLEKEGSNELKPSIVGLTQAFENLGKQNMSVGQLSELVGKMFGAQAAVLGENAQKAKELTEAITATNTAEEQAKTNTDNLDGALKSLASAWEGLNLHINNSNGFLRGCVDWLKDVVKWADAAFTSAGRAAKALADAQKTPIEGKSQIDLKIEALQSLPEDRRKERQAIDINQLQRQLEAKRREYAEWSPLIPWETPNNKEKREAFENEIKALEMMLSEYRRRSNEVLNPSAVTTTTSPVSGGSGETTKTKTPKALTPFSVKDVSGLGFRGPTQSMAELKAQLSMYEKMLDTATDPFDAGRAQQGIEETKRLIEAQPLALRIGMSAESVAEMKDQASILRDILETEFKENPLTITAGKGFVQEGQKAEDSWKAAASAVQTVGGALQSIEDPAAKVAGTVAQAIATVAMAYSQALSQDMGSKSNIFAFIAAAAAATVSMATTIASIHSATGYEQGGEIKGGSYSGDNIPIMANSGEVVLTRAMAGNLASQLSENRNNGGASSSPYVTGEKIVLGINNWGRRHGMGELVFSRG